MIENAVEQLVEYGLSTGLIKKADRIFIRNKILEALQLDEYTEPSDFKNAELEQILRHLTDFAVEKGLIEEGIVHRDLFDTRLMACLVPPPHEVIEKFNVLYEKSPESATQWYYEFSQNTDYIRRYRIKNDLRWTADTEYGKLDLSINLSKPEKDPKSIAAAKCAKQGGYPKCMLCRENEGYAGRVNHPARQNHRIIPIKLANEQWYFQYSPYVYYNEHCIVFNEKHIPMIIDKGAFEKLFEFIKLFPHYFVGSNADLPIVGGSILSHDHFQGGNYEFAMERAEIESYFTINGFEDIEAGIVKWPLSVLRIRHKDSSRLVNFADYILNKWRNYTDKKAFIFANTNGEPHNTITPIARKRGGLFELDLVLRNNITTEEHPLGVFHPHADLHHIKKENIGLIEVMGLAVLPARLFKEFAALKDIILSGGDLRSNELTCKHASWVEKFLPKYSEINSDNILSIIEYETGLVFAKVLEDTGVFKRDKTGREAFDRFISIL